MGLRGRCARGDVERYDEANTLNRSDDPSRTGLVRDDQSRCVHASGSDRLQPVTENAVCGFLTDPRGGNGMRAGGMTSDKAFSQLVAAPQLMSGRERPERGKRAQGNQCQGARPPTEPGQHLY